MNENIVEIRNLRKGFDKGKITALNGIDLNIKKGEFVSIIGPSGSGKSTLLNMIGALDRPDEGKIMVAGYDLQGKSDLSQFRSREIGFIFQLHNLIPNLSVVENVEIPMFESGLSGRQMREKALKLLDYMNLSDKASRKTTELSGGERQRKAIARSLANDPSIILADDPSGSLYSKNGDMILNLLKDLHVMEQVTLIMVTHDLKVAALAERTIEVLDGKIKT